MRLSIQGLQQAQHGMLRALRGVKPNGALGRAVQFLAAGAHRYLVTVTHVDTGAYRASHISTVEGPAQMRIFVRQNARNPRTRALVTSYAPVEEARGGEHAAYKRTVDYARSNLAPRAARILAGEVL